MQTLKCCYKLGRIKGMRQTWAWHFMSDVFVLLKSFWKWKFSNTVHCFTPFPCLVKSRSKGLLFSLSLRAKLIRYFMSSTCVHPSKVFSYKIKFSYARASFQLDKNELNFCHWQMEPLTRGKWLSLQPICLHFFPKMDFTSKSVKSTLAEKG